MAGFYLSDFFEMVSGQDTERAQRMRKQVEYQKQSLLQPLAELGNTLNEATKLRDDEKGGHVFNWQQEENDLHLSYNIFHRDLKGTLYPAEEGLFFKLVASFNPASQSVDMSELKTYKYDRLQINFAPETTKSLTAENVNDPDAILRHALTWAAQKMEPWDQKRGMPRVTQSLRKTYG